MLMGNHLRSFSRCFFHFLELENSDVLLRDTGTGTDQSMVEHFLVVPTLKPEPVHSN
jgi:hypothetical protein